ILRPSTPPLALISSAASCAACGIDAPAIAWASAMTPILIGSAASAWPETVASSPNAAAASSVRGGDANDEDRRDEYRIWFISFLSTDNFLSFYVEAHCSDACARSKRNPSAAVPN